MEVQVMHDSADFEDLDIIVVCYNCGDDIATLVDEIKQGDYPLDKIHLVIVDNASADNSLEILKKIDGIELKLIASPQNLGFGRGCNLALEHLKSGKTLLLNPDVHVYPNSLTNLLEFAAENPNALIWGGQTLNQAGNYDGKGAWREPTLRAVLGWAFLWDAFLKKLGRPALDGYEFSQGIDYVRADSISGCFFLIDTETFLNLEGFDPRFFMYSEEIDLCRRAREQRGATPLSTTRASIVHYGSQTLDSISKLDFLYYHKLKYFQKYWSTAKFKTAHIAIRLGTSLRIAAFSLAAMLNPSKRENARLWKDFRKIQKGWTF